MGLASKRACMELYLAEAVAYQVVCPERLHCELLEHNDGVKKFPLKIFNIIGTFSFHMYFRKNLVCPYIKYAYN